MFKLNWKLFLAPVIFASVLFGLLWFLIDNPVYLWSLLILGICVVVIGVIVVVKFVEKSDWKAVPWYCILPIILHSSIVLGFSFLSKELFQQIFSIIAFFLYILLFYGIEERKQFYKQIYLFLSVISAFFIFFGLYSIISLTGNRLVYYVFILGYFMLIFTQLLWFYGLFSKKAFLVCLVAVLVLFELSWFVLLWPVGSLIQAVVVGFLFYMFSGMVVDFLRGILTKRAVIEYTLISTVAIIATLFSANWFPN